MTKMVAQEDGSLKPLHDSRNIFQRLHAVMGEVDYVQKEKKAGMRYSIVSHDAVTAKVRPLLHKHGIIYFIDSLEYQQDGNRTQCKIVVTFANIDDQNDTLSAESFGYGVDDQDKGPGKAMSYAIKYALLKTLGLETGDDPDNDQDAVHQPAKYGPQEFAGEGSGTSAAKSKPAWKLLEDSLKKIESTKAIGDWWANNKKEIWKNLDNESFWRMYMLMLERATDRANNKLEFELFWSTQEAGLRELEKASYENHREITLYMMTKAKKLEGRTTFEEMLGDEIPIK